MSYRIKIERIETVQRKKTQWARLTAATDSPYGYTPEIETDVTETTLIYEQTVPNLSIEKVIAAINGMQA